MWLLAVLVVAATLYVLAGAAVFGVVIAWQDLFEFGELGGLAPLGCAVIGPAAGLVVWRRVRRRSWSLPAKLMLVAGIALAAAIVAGLAYVTFGHPFPDDD